MTRGIRLRILLAVLLGVLAIPVAIWRLTLTATAIFDVFQGAPFSGITGILFLIGGLIVARAALEFLRDEVADGTAARMKVRLRRQLYEHVLTLGAGHFDQRRTGNAVSALVESVERLEVFFGRYLPMFITAVLTPIILFAFMVVLDLRTALIFLFFALFALLAPYLLHRQTERASLDRHTRYSALNADFLDSMQGLTTLKVFGQSERRGRHLAQRARDVTNSTMRVLAINIGMNGMIMFGITGGSAIALAWGAVRVQDGTLDLRTLLVVLMLGVEVFRPLQKLSTVYHQGMMGQSAAKSVYELLDSRPEITERPSKDAPTSFKPEIQFKDVSFAYDHGRRAALSSCSFTLRPGETLGVVGPSGAGKSTLVSLLLRFVEPDRGMIRLGGYDLRGLPLQTLREQIAVVTQETYLFDGTIADNLRIGKPDADEDEMEQAAQLANAHDFITALPRGYDTLVGERGTRLSGGQRQRIAIARALLKDAPILVLDEALSSVDAENEAIIQQALERLQRGRTTLVIAHRLSSVINADRIIVLEAGRVVETGNHQSLLTQNGVYAALVAAQRDVEAEREAAAVPANQIASNGNPEPEANPATISGEGTSREALEHTPVSPIPLRTLATRLLTLVRPWPGKLALVITCGLLHALTLVAVGVVGALLVGRVVTGGETTGLTWLLLALVPLTALFSWLDSWLAHDLAYRLLAEMRITLYGLLDRLAPAYMYRRRSGDLLGTATHDIEFIELFYAHTIVPAMLSVLVPGGVLIALVVIHPALALALLPFLIAVALTPFFGRQSLERTGEDLRNHTGAINNHMVDSVQGLRTIAAFSYGPERTGEITRLGTHLSNLKHRFQRQQSFQMAAVESLTGLGSLAVLAVGAWHVSQGDLQRPALPLATLLALSAFAPVSSIATVAKELSETVAASRRYFAIEDEPVPVEDGPGAALGSVLTDQRRDGRTVSFESVTFRYSPTERPALCHLSFTVGAGQTVALVGGSGAGKTTIAHLLLRFWDPEKGRITIDGQDIREFTLDDLRHQIALVAQDTYLFHTTLLENLRLGRPDATDTEVFAAARQANVDDFVTALPDGYETLVGERGLQLSGGQRQRVAIARALLKNAPILILDEATSHLDAVNEMEVRSALEQLKQGRTTLVIAHRLSTIRNADQIIVLEGGRIAEQGTHSELVARDGLYSQLISSQIRGWSRQPESVESMANGE